MSVNRAYITSLGTTAILVASSLLVLAVTSTIVAFDGWPGHSAAAAVDRVTVKIPAVAAQPVPAASASSVTAATRTRVTAAGVAGTPGARRTAPTARTAPLEQPLPSGGDTTSGTGTATGSTVAQRQAPSTGPQDPAPRAGDPVRETAGTAGQAISPVSPTGSQAVVNAGEAVATVIDAVAPTAR
jgi:hypothetical protein